MERRNKSSIRAQSWYPKLKAKNQNVFKFLLLNFDF